jgi:hypothetical protein
VHGLQLLASIRSLELSRVQILLHGSWQEGARRERAEQAPGPEMTLSWDRPSEYQTLAKIELEIAVAASKGLFAAIVRVELLNRLSFA